MFRLITLLSFVFIFLFQQNLFADLQQNRGELKRIQQRIEAAEKDLQAKKKSEIKFSRELALLNSTLKRIGERISSLNAEHQQLKRKITSQENQIAAGRRTLRQTGKRLEKRLVALYKEGEVGPLKILFSADSPTELVQQYQYLTRVAEHDRELVTEYKMAIQEQQVLLAQLEGFKEQNQNVLDQEVQQRKVVEDGKRLQARLLKKVRSEKSQIKVELTQLQEKAKRLQALISRLQQGVVEPDAVESVSFVEGKGKLTWPADGPVVIDFGTQKDRALGTYYESNGLEIGVPIGSQVRAVADGKVVFADWFKGYGNLLILSHAGGYHTLYAQTERLEKKLGSKVAAGEVVGKSGLGGRESIYFEIRHNGAPVNPVNWLRRR